MAVTTDRNALNYLLHAGIDMVFGLDMREEPEEWLSLYAKRTSQKAFEERVMMSGPGYASVFGEDEPISYDSMRNSWNFITEHEKYGLAGRITEEAKTDNQYIQVVAKLGAGLSRSMKATRAARAAAPLNRATSASYTYGDGQPLLSTAHPLDGVVGGSLANTLSAQVDISEAAAEQLIQLADYAVAQNGLPINLEPKQWVIAKGLRFDFSRIMDARARPGTADNDPNAMRELGYASKPVVQLRFLTNRKQWGFTTKGSDGDGLVYYERWPMKRGEDTDFDTGSLRFKVYARDSFTVDDPRGFFGSCPT
jgi:hypothetical protein